MKSLPLRDWKKNDVVEEEEERCFKGCGFFIYWNVRQDGSGWKHFSQAGEMPGGTYMNLVPSEIKTLPLQAFSFSLNRLVGRGATISLEVLIGADRWWPDVIAW